jgi:hypothetical protein
VATKPKSVFAGVEPTPEQQKQRPFAIEPVVDEGQVKARAYRRQPLYVTLAKTSTPLTADQRQALDVYRELHDRSERSFTRSCLDIDHQGQMRRPDDVVHVNKAIREAREAISRVEAALGPIVSTLRAVALEDRSFSDVAMERFGSRKREWLKVDEPVRVNGRVVKVNGVVQRHPVFVEEIVPRSNKHRELIKQEYDQAVQMLARVVGAQNQARGAEEVTDPANREQPAIRRLQRCCAKIHLNPAGHTVNIHSDQPLRADGRIGACQRIVGERHQANVIR